jgi:outer membrane protein TolC
MEPYNKYFERLRHTTGLVVFCLLLLVAPAAYAVDLASLQEEAVSNREVIKRYQANLERSEQEIRRVKGPYFPSLDLAYTANSLDDPSFTESRENSVSYGAVSWNLFSGFRDKYNIKSAVLRRDVENHSLNGIRQDIQLNVALRYLQVYDRKANLQVAEDAYNTLGKLYRDSQNRLEVGLIGQNELLRFKVDYDQADITVKAAKADLDKSVHLLGREVGRSLGLAELSFAEFSSTPALGEQEKYQDEMLKKRSEILALERLTEAAGMRVKSRYSSYYPQVDIVGSYSKYDDHYVNGSGDYYDEELRAQVVVSLNLFDGFSRESTISQAKLEEKGLKYDLAELKDTLRTDLANLFIDYQVSLENVSVADENIKHAKESLRISQLKYKEGLESETDLLDAVTNLSRAQYNYVTVVRTVFENYFHITRMVEGF